MISGHPVAYATDIKKGVDMPKYRKKPVVIEAEQFDESLEQHERLGLRYISGNMSPIIETLEGPLTVSPGDWIITGVQGERYPCKPDIFEATYEPVEDRP